MYQEIIKKADNLLEKYNIKEPVVNVFQIAQDEGIELKFVDMPEKLKNVAGFFDPEDKSIFVNNDDSPNRQMFTVAHELGHYILDHKPGGYGVLLRLQQLNGENPPVEKQANCFAANLLVPELMLRKIIRKYNIISDKKALLAKIFGVSKEMMGYRIKSLKIKV